MTHSSFDWITVLKGQQEDFIHRLRIKPQPKSSHRKSTNHRHNLLFCRKKNVHSELAEIQGDQLKKIRDYCWGITERFVPQQPHTNLKETFVRNFKGKLAEAVVYQRLEELVDPVDYEIKTRGGDGRVDLRLKTAPHLGIQVKSSNYPHLMKVKWTIDREEIEKNKVIVCVWIKEEVTEAQGNYHLYFAGFLATDLMTDDGDKVELGIKDLLYNGGLISYIQSLLKVEERGIKSLLKEAQAQVKAGKRLEAIQIYHQILTLNPKHKRAYQKRAQLYFELEDYEKAIQDYNQALNWGSQSFYLYHYRGIAHYYERDYQKAIADSTKAIEAHPQLGEAFLNRGQCFVAMGELEKAIADYDQALTIQPTASTYGARGWAYFKLGNYEKALEDYTQALAQEPTFAIAYYYRGLVKKELDDETGAIADYTQALEEGVTQAEVYFHRGKLLDKQGQHQVALSDYDQSLKLNPHSAQAYCSRGLTKNKIGNPLGAISDYTRAINLQPDYTQAYYRRGAIRNVQGDPTGAIADYTRTLELDPDYALAYYNRGEIYQTLEQNEEAIANFQEASRLFQERGNEVYAQMANRKLEQLQPQPSSSQNNDNQRHLQDS